MKNSWLEKSENRYAVTVAGLELEQLIAKMQALQFIVKDIEGICQGVERNTKEYQTTDDVKKKEEILERYQNQANWIRRSMDDLRNGFNDALLTLVQKRGKWVR